MAANYVNPLLNQPTDPFLQEQLEEQRRYDEQREARKRAEAIEDWSRKTQLDREYADSVRQDQREYADRRADLLYDRSREDRMSDLELQRDWRREDLETARGYDEQDAKRDRKRTKRQSGEMASELEPLRNELSSIENRRRQIINNLLVTSPGQQVPEAARKRTELFHNRILGELQRNHPTLNTNIPNRGVTMASTDGFKRWVASEAARLNNPRLLSDYEAMESHERKRLEGNSEALYSLAAQQQQLLKRQDTILQRVRGGGVDYSTFQNSATAGITNTVDLSQGRDMATDPDGSTAAAEAARLQIQTDKGQGGLDDHKANVRQSFDLDDATFDEALSGLDEMGDAFGNWDSDQDNMNALNRMLNAPAASPQHKLAQLDEIERRLDQREQDYKDQHKKDMADAQQDARGWFGSWSGGNEPDVAAWDPRPQDVDALFDGRSGGLGVIRKHVENKRVEVLSQQPSAPVVPLGPGYDKDGNPIPANPPSPNPPNLAPGAAPGGGVVIPQPAPTTQPVAPMNQPPIITPPNPANYTQIRRTYQLLTQNGISPQDAEQQLLDQYSPEEIEAALVTGGGQPYR